MSTGKQDHQTSLELGFAYLFIPGNGQELIGQRIKMVVCKGFSNTPLHSVAKIFNLCFQAIYMYITRAVQY